MKKDNLRDYAVQAFMCYSQLGCPTRDELEGRIRLEVHRRMEGEDPKLIVLASDKELLRWEPYLADVDAVGEMLRELEERGRGDIAAAVRYVYFVKPSAVLPDQVDPRLRRNEITDRATRFSMKSYVTMKTVYTWLRQARALFALKRGLAQW